MDSPQAKNLKSLRRQLTTLYESRASNQIVLLESDIKHKIQKTFSLKKIHQENDCFATQLVYKYDSTE